MITEKNVCSSFLSLGYIPLELSSYWVLKSLRIVPLLNHWYTYLGIICITLLILSLVSFFFLFHPNILTFFFSLKYVYLCSLLRIFCNRRIKITRYKHLKHLKCKNVLIDFKMCIQTFISLLCELSSPRSNDSPAVMGTPRAQILISNTVLQ